MSEPQPTMSLSGIVVRTEQDRRFTEQLKRIVSKAGGEWCGIQESMIGDPPLLLFNSPKSDSTLAVKFNPIDFDPARLEVAIRKRLEESDKNFADHKITVKASLLEGMLANTNALVVELEKMLGRAK